MSVLYPLNVASLLPDTNLSSTVYFNECAFAMLFSIEPFSIINSAVLPFKHTHALALIVHEVALVLLSVSPLEDSMSVHFVFLPFSRVGFTIRPDILSMT